MGNYTLTQITEAKNDLLEHGSELIGAKSES